MRMQIVGGPRRELWRHRPQGALCAAAAGRARLHAAADRRALCGNGGAAGSAAAAAPATCAPPHGLRWRTACHASAGGVPAARIATGTAQWQSQRLRLDSDDECRQPRGGAGGCCGGRRRRRRGSRPAAQRQPAPRLARGCAPGGACTAVRQRHDGRAGLAGPQVRPSSFEDLHPDRRPLTTQKPLPLCCSSAT